MNDEKQLSTTGQPNPFAMTTFDDVVKMAGYLAKANTYGLKEEAQFVSLMMMAHEEQITLGRLMQRVHVFPDGKLSNRADWLQAEFEEKAGKIIWHTRTDDICVATFILGKEVTKEQEERAAKRAELLMDFEIATWTDPRNPAKETEILKNLQKLAKPGEETVLRSAADADSKGLSLAKSGSRKDNWHTSPRAMLQWRAVSEGVKVVCPRILSGMPTDVEYNDVRMHQEREAARIRTEPKPGDEEAIRQMIAQHDEELATDLSDGRRKTVLGLRADLVCKLADMGITYHGTPPEGPAPTVGGHPAKTVETVVLPPEQPKQPTSTAAAPKTRQRRQPPASEAADAADTIPMSWRDIECHVGPNPGRCFGRKLADVFAIGDVTKQPRNEKQVDDLVAWFGTTQLLANSVEPKDKTLWAAVQEAAAARKAEIATAQGQTQATQPATTTAPAQTTVEQSWQDYVIPGKHPDFSGKTLGSLTEEQRKQLRDEYLPQINWETATISQKTLRAKVALAVGHKEPEPQSLPSTASEPAAHTTRLEGSIKGSNWTPAIFLQVCKMNDWVSESHRTIADITPEELEQLSAEWDTVKTEVDKAHQGTQA